MTGFDSLVDELMACHGYDRDEAELIATARLSGVPEAAVKQAAYQCDPCECGGLCDECEDHPYWDAVLDEFGGAASCEEPS